jgi:hypothetical protein
MLPQYRWILRIFLIALSAVRRTEPLSETTTLDGAGLAMALWLVLGHCSSPWALLFDIIGVAVTAADERPFHSMAAHKEKGAAEALYLLHNASHVSSFCNDVVGDICGIVSGTTAAVIVSRLQSALNVHSLF